MAGKWEGFTEDEIKFYLPDQKQTNHDNLKTDSQQYNEKIANLGKARKKIVPKEKRNVNFHDPKEKYQVPEAALLLKSATKVSSMTISEDIEDKKENVVSDVKIDKNEANKLDVIDNDSVLTNDTSREESLEKFHNRQKLLEEQNRQRKEYLAKVLLDRKKQTNQEAARLQTIQQELHKLDVLLSDDVSILRDEIEIAAKDFGEAQKRFNRAEKEFLEAKQSLFAKMERKELLTKHLCTIIEQNELRKAQKLSELMNKLSLPEPPPVLATPQDSSITSQSLPVSNDNAAFEKEAPIS